MYDAIVVGARCAGSPTAMLLARKGYRVLLVDRATFPSDTISTHIIWQQGTARLKHWGLLDRVAESNCPPIRKLTLDVGEFALAGTLPPVDGVAEAYAPRRTVLDKILLDAAAAAGAEVREGFAVTDVVMDGDRVTGIRGRSDRGANVADEARLVVGADGRHSIVARAIKAPEYDAKPTLACWYYTYWSGIRVDGIEMHDLGGRAAGLIPTNGDLVCIPVVVAYEHFHEFRADVEGSYLQTIDLSPSLAERIRAGRREEPFRAMSDVPNFFRKPYGPGWTLVGDAGYHKDPVTAQGISDAFRDAEALTDAIDAGLGGRRPLEEALAEYEQRRNEAAIPMYEYTCELAALAPPPPEMQALFAALRGNQDDTNCFLGTIAGTVPILEFFAPSNLERIMAGAHTAASA
ncbi:MAG: NAD(P)/FAD-dependent oxidoreductase [Chloroflexota bacterium]|nr:NAD(P)/FAD-dependent oxidoreductase [Chloroflexota bacterium]